MNTHITAFNNPLQCQFKGEGLGVDVRNIVVIDIKDRETTNLQDKNCKMKIVENTVWIPSFFFA